MWLWQTFRRDHCSRPTQDVVCAFQITETVETFQSFMLCTFEGSIQFSALAKPKRAFSSWDKFSWDCTFPTLSASTQFCGETRVLHFLIITNNVLNNLFGPIMVSLQETTILKWKTSRNSIQIAIKYLLYIFKEVSQTSQCWWLLRQVEYTPRQNNIQWRM